MKFLTIDEVSMVLNDLWTDIDSSLGKIFMMIPEKAFAALLVMTEADMFPLPPVIGKVIFSILCIYRVCSYDIYLGVLN